MIAHLASLSRLEFDEADALQIKEDLTRMIAFVEKLQEIDTTGVEPLLHMTENKDIFRADETNSALPRNIALGLAPDADDQYFYVPKVIKK